jgi:sec-independent protein translocase protein TatC
MANEENLTFLEHLEALRWHLVRSTIAVVVMAILLFGYNDFVFNNIIFASRNTNFITYRALCHLSHYLHLDQALCITNSNFELINTNLAGQFTMHIWVSIVGGAILASPYIFFEIWKFVKPALSKKELSYSRGILFFALCLFIVGVLFGFYVITPLSVNFLGNYAVSNQVKNMLEIESFVSTVTTITLASGFIFELPVAIYFLSEFGIITPEFMRRYRKHAVVVILILAAVITPSPDVTSQILVATPIYVLYEISVFISKYVQLKKVKKGV